MKNRRTNLTVSKLLLGLNFDFHSSQLYRQVAC